MNSIYYVVHYIPSTYLSYNWKSVRFDCPHPIPSPPTPTSGGYMVLFKNNSIAGNPLLVYISAVGIFIDHVSFNVAKVVY